MKRDEGQHGAELGFTCAVSKQDFDMCYNLGSKAQPNWSVLGPKVGEGK